MNTPLSPRSPYPILVCLSGCICKISYIVYNISCNRELALVGFRLVGVSDEADESDQSDESDELDESAG